MDLEELMGQQDYKIRTEKFPQMIHPKTIPLLVSGGVGDVIMSLPLVCELASMGNVEIITRHAQAFDYFKPIFIPKASGSTIPPYTWFIEMNTVVRFRFQEHFYTFNNSKIENIYNKQVQLFSHNNKLRSMVRNHPHYDNALARYAKDLGLDRRAFPFFSVGLKPWPGGKKDRREALNYITIHDGYEGESAHVVPGRATKTWKWDHWNSLVKSLKKQYPTTQIIQLGTFTGRPIDGVDQCLLNQTTLVQAFELISRAKMHIDGDSGLVHAATKMQVPCVVMFGPTPDHFYGYPENINIRTNHCSDACYWLKDDWLGHCPIGLNEPECMNKIDPDLIMQIILANFDESLNKKGLPTEQQGGLSVACQAI